MKSESDTHIRRALYSELNLLSEKGKKIGTDALRRDARGRDDRRDFFHDTSPTGTLNLLPIIC